MSHGIGFRQTQLSPGVRHWCSPDHRGGRVLRLHARSSGRFQNVAALIGAQFALAQKDLLTRSFPQIVLMLDGDETGQTAMVRIARNLTPACTVIQVPLPDNLQPDQTTTD